MDNVNIFHAENWKSIYKTKRLFAVNENTILSDSRKINNYVFTNETSVLFDTGNAVYFGGKYDPQAIYSSQGTC